jgi:hypothetical protein
LGKEVTAMSLEELAAQLRRGEAGKVFRSKKDD